MSQWLANNCGEWLTGLSIILAAVTWYISQRRNRRDQKLRYTVELISNISTNDRLAESNFKLARLIQTGKTIDEAAIDEETDRYVMDMLNYYEHLCEVYYKGLLDEASFRHLRGGAMCRTWSICAGYVEDRRVKLNAPELYGKLEAFVREQERRTMQSS